MKKKIKKDDEMMKTLYENLRQATTLDAKYQALMILNEWLED